MGSQLEFHIGVYLKVKVKKVQDSPRYFCVDHPNRSFAKAEFCQRCGKALTKTPPQFSLPHISELLPDDEDEFMQPSVMEDEEHIFLLSNICSEKSPSKLDTKNKDEIELTAHTIEYCTLNFIARHKRSIKRLRDLLECEEISIKFGVIQYYT